MKPLSIAVAVALFLGGCGGAPPRPVRTASGTMKTESRDVGEVDTIHARGIGVLKVRVGPERSLSVTADEEFLPLIITEVSGGELQLHLAPGDFDSGGTTITYELTMPAVSKVVLSGVVEAEIGELNVPSFEAHVAGRSTLLVDGSLGETTLTIEGDSSATAAGTFEAVTVNAAGTCRCTLSGAAESVDLNLSGNCEADTTALEVPKIRGDLTGRSSLFHAADSDVGLVSTDVASSKTAR